MHLAELESALDEFLKHDTRRVLLLKGAWGTGKTYFWSKKYVPCRLKSLIKMPYAYVSLFGSTSIQNITKRIFYAPMLGEGPMQKRSVELLKAGGLQGLKRIPKAIPFIKNFDISIDNLEGLLIRKYLICFDDLERMGEGLRMQDFMGLVSQLKEQRGCKIVLIMNDAELNDDRGTFDKYREKVVDLECEYTPKISDNIRIACPDEKLRATFTNVFEELEITNIRIAQHATWNCEAFEGLVDGVDGKVRKRIMRDIAILTCFHCQPGTGVELERLQEMHSPTSPSSITDEDRDNWDLFRRLRFDHDPIHEHIIELIRTNSFDRAEFEKEIQRLNGEHEKRAIEEKCFDVWEEVYSSGFTTSGDELVREFTNFLNEHACDLSRKSLIEMISVLEELDPKSKGQEWINQNILGHIEDYSLKEVMDAENWTQANEIKRMLEERKSLLTKDRTIDSVVKRIADNKSCSPRHILFLASQDEDAWYEWFKTYTSPDFFPDLRTFHTIFNAGSDEDDQRRIGVVMQAALRRIAQDDPLNAIKIKKNFRLKLD